MYHFHLFAVHLLGKGVVFLPVVAGARHRVIAFFGREIGEIGRTIVHQVLRRDTHTVAQAGKAVDIIVAVAFAISFLFVNPFAGSGQQLRRIGRDSRFPGAFGLRSEQRQAVGQPFPGTQPSGKTGREV